jgi:hypothetical protein
MAYSDIAALQQDADFAFRVQAAYAVETLADTDAIDPGSWQAMHSWDMAAQPGFGDAYASAIAGSVDRPGNDPSVITDGQILSAIQSLLPQAPVEEGEGEGTPVADDEPEADPAP